MSSKALSRPVNIIARARKGALATLLANVAEDDIAVVVAANRACEFDTQSQGMEMLKLPVAILKEAGWASKAELRIAVDAKLNSREVPFYLKMAHERTLMRYRGQEGEATGEGAVIVMPSDPAPNADEGHALPPVPAGDDETNR